MVGGRAPAQRSLTSVPGRPDPRHGLYGPGSEAWRLNREAALLLGAGPRALLLQLAHPLVAEGVAAHSDFRADPWARLAGTLRSYLRIVYGTVPTARAELERLQRLHGGVSGPSRDPAAARLAPSYAALDPELGLWVHATLVDSTMVTAHAWAGPLPQSRRRRFYDETLPVARLLGIPGRILPPDVDAFDAYVAAMLGPVGPVHPTATARELAHAVLHPPLAPLVERGALAARLGPLARPLAAALGSLPPDAASWLLLPSVGLLPPATRAEYGLAWGRPERLVAAWLATAWRAWRPVLPAALRWFPQALAAGARVRPGGSRA